MHLPSNHHLSYCTNIHPGHNWEETLRSLKEFVPSIKDRIAPEREFGLGLRLSNQASEELGLGDKLVEFQSWLEEEQCYVYTINGFPYGSFHHKAVKEKVHKPDWTTGERVIYTERLARQLAYLLPPGGEGGISTSPVSYRHWFKEKHREKALREGARNLVLIAGVLMAIEEESGVYIHLDIEPEPDGMLENTADFVAFYTNYLLPEGMSYFQEVHGLQPAMASTLLRRYITMCYDICHFSLAYESPGYTFSELKKYGIRIGKIQISAALRIRSEAADPSELFNALQAFDEPIYLHQVTQKTEAGVKTYRDLGRLLKEKPEFNELRAHFHVPVFLDTFGVLESTQDDIVSVLKLLEDIPEAHHLEVETYTWDVLPPDMKLPLTDSITRELQWVIQHL